MGPKKKMVAKRYKASKPLLAQSKVQKGKYYLPTTSGASPLDTHDGPLFMMKKKRRTSLHWYDAAIMLLEILQLFALIETMALRWAWPKTFVNYSYFLFLFNLDVWEFMKVLDGVYLGNQNYFSPSTEMSFSFNFIILGWGLILLAIIGISFAVYAVMRYRKSPYLLVHLARIEKAAIILTQVLALPVGTVMAKLFQCTDVNSQVVPLNEVTCFVNLHWAYVTLSIIITILIFFVIPGWMIRRTRHELLAMNSQHHETYLQLKEMEYMSGLDVIWMVKGFHIFSSFKLRSAYFRPVMHLFKLCLLAVYAAGVSHIQAQSISATVIVFVMWLAIIILRPFRIVSFNVMLIFGYLCLLGDLIIGSSLASVSPSEVISPWLVEPYSTYVLVGINCTLVLSMLVFIIHLLVYNFYCHRRRGLSPLWPNMANQGADKVSEETKKYMVAVLKARTVVEKCRSVNPLFSPLHELSKQIQIVNAFMREAEKLDDGLHDTLWDLLDEMIQLHQRLEPLSLFGDNVKDSIKSTALELMKIMPMFTRRLAQRDYDLILVSPLKRRMLLKMLAMGFFLNGRSERVARKQITGPEMTKMWPESANNPKVEDQIEYYEDLIPPPPQGPDQEQMFLSESLTLPMQLVDVDEDEQSVSSILLAAPEIRLLSPTPSRPSSGVSQRSQHGIVNPAFEGQEDSGQSEGHAGGQPDTVVDLEDFQPGETTTDDLPGTPLSADESEENTSSSPKQPRSSPEPDPAESFQITPVDQKKKKKKSKKYGK